MGKIILESRILTFEGRRNAYDRCLGMVGMIEIGIEMLKLLFRKLFVIGGNVNKNGRKYAFLLFVITRNIWRNEQILKISNLRRSNRRRDCKNIDPLRNERYIDGIMETSALITGEACFRFEFVRLDLVNF